VYRRPLAILSRDRFGVSEVCQHDPVTATARLRRKLLAASPAAFALGGLVVVWVATFAVLVVRRHEQMWDVDLDMGLYDQAVWLVAHGRGFMTVRGLPVFGHHGTFGLALFAPASWLGAGPNFLNVTQVVALGAGAVPVYLLARERALRPATAALLGAAFLLHPALQFFSWELFHPEALAITPLLCAYLCAVRRSWGWFAGWALLAVSFKEDVAIAVLVLGLLIALRGDRRVGLLTVGAAAAWFAVVVWVMIPAVSGGGAHYESLYSGVGGSAGGILETAVTDPGNITSRVFSDESSDFAWKLTAPFGFVPLLGPAALAIGLPQFLLDVVSDVEWTRTITFRYAALPLVALAIAMVEGVAFLRRRLSAVAEVIAATFVAGCAVFGTLAWGPSPVGAEYDKGWWPAAEDTRLDVKQAAIDLVPDGASVSASYTLVPQLSRRAEIYSFPNPWKTANWGVPGTASRDPARVDWLVLDCQPMTEEDRSFVASIVLNGFEVVSHRDDVLVARRTDRRSARSVTCSPTR